MHNNKCLCKVLSLSCWWCVIFTINLALQKYVCERGRDGVTFMCAHVYNVALCCNTVRNVALGIWLVGHPCNSKTHTSKPGVPKLSLAMYPFSVWIDEHVPLNMGAGSIFSKEGPISDFPGLGQKYFARGNRSGKITFWSLETWKKIFCKKSRWKNVKF